MKQLVAGITAQAERSGTDRILDLAANKARGNACAGESAQAVMVAARPGFSLRLAVLMQARWNEFGWLIRLVVMTAMFWLSFCGLSLFLDLRAAGRGRMLCEAGDPRFLSAGLRLAKGPVDFCQCLLGAVLALARSCGTKHSSLR